MATKLPLERVGQAWWLSRENKAMETRTIYVPSAELTLPEPRRSVVIKKRRLAAAHAAARRPRGPPRLLRAAHWRPRAALDAEETLSYGLRF